MSRNFEYFAVYPLGLAWELTRTSLLSFEFLWIRLDVAGCSVANLIYSMKDSICDVNCELELLGTFWIDSEHWWVVQKGSIMSLCRAFGGESLFEELSVRSFLGFWLRETWERKIFCLIIYLENDELECETKTKRGCMKRKFIILMIDAAGGPVIQYLPELWTDTILSIYLIVQWLWDTDSVINLIVWEVCRSNVESIIWWNFFFYKMPFHVAENTRLFFIVLGVSFREECREWFIN